MKDAFIIILHKNEKQVGSITQLRKKNSVFGNVFMWHNLDGTKNFAAPYANYTSSGCAVLDVSKIPGWQIKEMAGRTFDLLSNWTRPKRGALRRTDREQRRQSPKSSMKSRT